MTEDDYDAALAEITALMDIPPETLDGAGAIAAGLRLAELAFAVETYEKEHYPMGKPTPEAAAAFRADQERE